MKIKVLMRSYLKLFFQDFLYLTMLFAIIIFGFVADQLLDISSVKKFSLLMIGMFFLALFSMMNAYHNDSQQNEYLKQKVNSYWWDALAQFLVALIVNIFSGILIFIFSQIFNRNILLDVSGILTLISVGMLGTGIATLFKTQWYRHQSLGQIGTLVFVLLALSGSTVGLLNVVEWILPPLSKLITTVQTEDSITRLLPLAGQTFIYADILYIISGFLYHENKKN